LIPEGALGAMTRMVLANAIYFKADWLDQFAKESTRDAPFHLLVGSVIETPTMSQGINNLPFFSSPGVQVVELAYAGNTAVMDIFVPDEGNFTSFESALSLEGYEQLLAGLQATPVMLSLPKFSFTSSVNLSDKLIELGMSDAFDPERADFTGMSSLRELFISDVLHKAFIAVDEEGTEAAAATAVIMGVASAPMFEISLDIDRPFIFLIRDLSSGQILFVGRVVDPRS
jgi:serpin B